MQPALEDVFKKSGLPTFTFVKPQEYNRVHVALRTPGRGVVIEGPSGIGKTTTILKALDELGLTGKTTILSPKKKEDLEYIEALPQMGSHGIVAIDDFHKLSANNKKLIADYMKTLADEERIDAKVIAIGINESGASLITFASDLTDRLEKIKFGKSGDSQILELIQLGESALNIKIHNREQIVSESVGSFHIAQIICHEACLSANVLKRDDKLVEVNSSIAFVKERILEDYNNRFWPATNDFCSGHRIRKEGRAPYLHLLYWLSMKETWTLNVKEAILENPNHQSSIEQVVERNHLSDLFTEKPSLKDILHFESSNWVLSTEDPKYFFYIKNLPWFNTAKRLGFRNIDFTTKYDFALSFAGEDRTLAEAIFEKLCEEEISVFYDKNEEHRILAEVVEDYLSPIYRSEAKYIICVLSSHYPKKVWTNIESEQFKHRFGENAVIPIWFSNQAYMQFDESRKYGGFDFNPSMPISDQVEHFVEVLRKKLSE